MKQLSLDLETYSDIDLSKAGVYKYAQSDNFRILLLAYCYDHEDAQIIDLASGENLPEQVRHDILDDAVIKTAFNAQFERVCLSKALNHPLKADSWNCTMIQSAILGLPLSLKAVGEALNLAEQKLDDGRRLINYFSKPTKDGVRHFPQDDPEKWQQFKEYCVRDVEVEQAIRHKLRNFPIPPSLQEEYILDQQINDRGIKVDKNLVRRCIQRDDQLRERYTTEMQKLTALENPNSVGQVKAWLADNGLPMDSLGKKEVLEVIDTAPEPLRTVLKLRQKLSKSSIAKYRAMESAECTDGRIRGCFQFYGANRTGRWSGRLVQLQNLAQNHMENLAEVREQVASGNFEGIEPEHLSELVRTALIPEEGKKFIVCDFSAIEARVLSWLAGEKWRLDVFEGDGKIYEATASRMFGVPVEKVGKTSIERQKAKQAELACGYQGSVGALKRMGALEMGITESELQPLVNQWRESSPNIVEFWYKVDDTVRKVAKGTSTIEQIGDIIFTVDRGLLQIRLPSGRTLYYHKPQIGCNKFGMESVKFKGVGENKKWSVIESYGGKFVENITQATARDLLTHAMRNLDQHGYKIVAHIHDEVVIEADTAITVESVAEIMKQPPEWAKDLPLDADGYECQFYKKD